MPRSLAKSLASTMASPPDTQIPASHRTVIRTGLTEWLTHADPPFGAAPRSISVIAKAVQNG